MATHSKPLKTAKPLMTAAAFASAAAIAVATPAIAPSVSVPTPHALSTAQVQLASFADLLSLTLNDYWTAYSQGWGGFLGSENDVNADAAWNVWSGSCAYAGGCYSAGLPGIAYIALDTLINGGTTNVNAVNYYFEGGEPAGSEYLLQSSFGQSNPLISAAISLAFAGPQVVSQLYYSVWSAVGTIAGFIPVVGPYIAGGIDAYINGYGAVYQGLGAVVAYVGDLITAAIGGLVPAPTAASAPAAAVAAAAAASPVLAGRVAAAAPVAALKSVAPVSAASTSTDTPKVETPKVETSTVETPKVETATVETPKVEATPEVNAPETEPTSTDTSAESTPEVKPEVKPETKPETKPGASSSATKPADRSSHRPVRDALDKVSKQVTSALTKAGATDRSAAGADSAS